MVIGLALSTAGVFLQAYRRDEGRGGCINEPTAFTLPLAAFQRDERNAMVIGRQKDDATPKSDHQLGATASDDTADAPMRTDPQLPRTRFKITGMIAQFFLASTIL
jgi:hypothetical protein